jgi:SAM-dependent methyltransferase
MGRLGWSYTDLLAELMRPGTVALDVGTGGGEVFSAVARPSDVALDLSLDMLTVARERLPCSLVVGDQSALPFREACVDIVADRHVGVDPREVLRVLRPDGLYITQQVGGRICDNIFEAFGWGSNEAHWRRYAEQRGEPYWDVAALVDFYEAAGCKILRRDEAIVDYEFLDEESLAFWLMNAPLPERPDPNRHADVLAKLPLKTNWHSELLLVRR